MSADPKFPAAKLDAYKTASGEADACGRCSCVPGVTEACDRPELCSCHWRQSDIDAINADAALADRKEA